MNEHTAEEYSWIDHDYSDKIYRNYVSRNSLSLHVPRIEKIGGITIEHTDEEMRLERLDRETYNSRIIQEALVIVNQIECAALDNQRGMMELSGHYEPNKVYIDEEPIEGQETDPRKNISNWFTATFMWSILFLTIGSILYGFLSLISFIKGW